MSITIPLPDKELRALWLEQERLIRNRGYEMSPIGRQAQIERIQILRLLMQVLNLEEEEMFNLDKIKAAVDADTAAVNSAVTLIKGLADEIRNLPADQTAINDLADSLSAKAQELADAVVANTPAE